MRLLEANASQKLSRLAMRRNAKIMREVGRVNRAVDRLVDEWADGGMQGDIEGQLMELVGDHMETAPYKGYRWAVDDLKATLPRAHVKYLGRKNLWRPNRLSGQTVYALKGSGRLGSRDAARVKNELLFPPMSEKKAAALRKRSIIGDRKTWSQRISRLARQERTAGAANEAGEYGDQGERDNFADGLRRRVAHRAKTIARTELLRVYELAALEASRRLSPVIVAMRLLSQNDNRVRPLHHHRHGRVYVRKGNRFVARGTPPLMPLEPAVLPRLPDSPNCRCFTVPIFETLR